MGGPYENKILIDQRDTAPVIAVDGSGYGYARGTKRGEIITQSVNDEMLAIEGSFGVLSTAAPGTGIASQASVTAYDATKLVLVVKNNETVKSCIVRYIKIFVGTVPGGSGTQKYEFRLDTQSGLTSGGTALTNKRCNLGVTSLFSAITATAGAMTTVAGTPSESIVYSGQMRNGVGLAGDVFLFTFGGAMNVGGFLDPATTVGEQKTLAHGPLVISPGGALRMAHYGASLSTAATLQWEIGVIVR